jgi:hypothetical protein
MACEETSADMPLRPASGFPVTTSHHFSFIKSFKSLKRRGQGPSSMAKIIKFPFEEQREWNRIERKLTELLHKSHAPEEVIEQVLSWFEGVWFKYRDKFRIELRLKLENVPNSTAEVCKNAIETAVKETILQMREVSYEVFGELIAMKIRLEMLKYQQNL